MPNASSVPLLVHSSAVRGDPAVLCKSARTISTAELQDAIFDCRADSATPI